MHVVRTIAELRVLLDEARHSGRTIGFVPTMGYLHTGHRSLLDASVRDGHATLLSIFVNPLQFAANEDLGAYPRDLDADLAMASDAGAEWVFVPEVAEMYPRPVATTVSVHGLGTWMEGSSRPTHFDGVATVVTKLFSIAGTCSAYFGEKDYQQLAIIRRMATDLSMPVNVIGCPTVREPDGLAKSSRNVYLSADERAAAPVLIRALCRGAELVRGRSTDPATVRHEMAAMIDAEPLGALDYVEIADAETLEPVDTLDGPVRIFGAVRFGRARLIDNVGEDMTIERALGARPSSADATPMRLA